MSQLHVAILRKPYLDLILSGTKTVESRLTRTLLPPFKAVTPGDRIYFKQSCGPFRAMARAGRAEYHADLCPGKVDALRRRHNGSVCGDESYWQSKSSARYASLISLEQVVPIDAGPAMPPSRGRAWFVLDRNADPCFDVTVTGGALRNGYIYIPRRLHRFHEDAYGKAGGSQRGRAIKLLLPAGETIHSDVLHQGRFRWRGWATWFRRHQAQVGDVVRFMQLAPYCYRIMLIRANGKG